MNTSLADRLSCLASCVRVIRPGLAVACALAIAPPLVIAQDEDIAKPAQAERNALPPKGAANLIAAPPEFLPRPFPNELRVLNVLKEPTEVAFNDNPLEDALRYLKDLHQVEIWIDKEALSAKGIATDTQVNLSLSGISLRSVLRLMLEPLALTYVVENEVLKVTTQEAADRTVVTRTYPVGDLFATREEAEELVESLVCGLGLTQRAKVGLKLLAVSVPSGAIIARLSRPLHDELLQLLRDLREAKSLAPKQLVPANDLKRGLAPTGDAPRTPNILDEFSPGPVPDESQKRRRVPDANLDEPAPSFEVPAPPKAKTVR